MNKKKVTKLTALSAIFTLAVAGGIMAGCGHSHDVSAVGEVAATCTTDGHEAYYKCGGCDKIFKDADGKQEITFEQVKIDKLGHDAVHKPAKDADCTTEGNAEYWGCSRCDAAFSDANYTPYDGDPILEKLGHLNLDINYTPYKAPTLEADGDIEHYHCDRCDKDFADSYGDEELDNVIIEKPVELENVSLTVKGYKDGKETPLSGALTLEGQYEQSASGTATDGAATIAKVWSIKYKATLGEYTGEVKFEKNKTDYTVVLEFNYATYTGSSKSTTNAEIPPANKSQIDLSNANNENHTITMRDFTWDTVDYTEAKLNIPDEVKNSKYATVSFTLKYLDGSMYGNSRGESGFNPLARFGVKMTAENGVFALMHDKGYAEAGGTTDRIMACPFMPSSFEKGIFDGYDDMNTASLFAPVSSALKNDGLPVRVVRANTYIRLFVQVNGEWTELVNYQGSATCSASAETDIRLVINGHEWEFSDIEFSSVALVHEEIPTTAGATYKPDHMVIDEQYFNADGTLTSEAALSLELKEFTLSFEGYRDGNSSDITTGTVEFTNERTGQNFSVALGADGKATVNLLVADDAYRAQYAYKVVCGDYYDAGVEFRKSQPNPKLWLEFNYAESTGNGSKNSKVDLVNMNNADHTLVLSDSGVWDTLSYTEAKLNLPDDVKNSKFTTVSFKLTHDALGYNGSLDENAFNPVARWGVKMTERGGIGINMNESSHMTVFKLYKAQEDSTNPEEKTPEQPFWGWDSQSAAYNEYLKEIASAMHGGGGLNVRVVRAGTYIRMFVELRSGWVELLNEQNGVVTVEESTPTDIRFLILAHEWTFSQIDFAKTELKAEVSASTTAPGMRAHIQIGEQYFNPDGTLTTQQALVIPQLITIDSVALKLTDKNGADVAANTAVVLTNADVGTVNVTVGSNGVIALEKKVYAGYPYIVTVAGYAFSYEVTFGDEEQYAIRLEDAVDWKYSDKSTLTVERGDYPSHWDGTFAVTNSDSKKIQIDAEYPVSSSVAVNTGTALDGMEVYTLYFNLKSTFAGGWQDKFGIRVTDATGDEMCGFWFFLRDNNILTAGLRGKINLDNNNASESASIVTKAMFEAGVDMKLVKNGREATLYARIGGEWKPVNTVTLGGSNAKIAFAASAGTHVFTNVALAASSPEQLDSVTFTLTDSKGVAIPEGTKVTLESAKGTVETTVGANGIVTLTGATAVYDNCTYFVRINGSMNEYAIMFDGAEAEITNVYVPSDWSYSDPEKLEVVQGEGGSGGLWDTGSFSVENSTADTIKIEAVYAVSKEVVLDTGTALTGTDVYTLDFSLKSTFEGGWKDKFGIRLTDATGDDICGFWFFLRDNNILTAGLRGKINLDGNGAGENSCILTQAMFEAGVDMRIERVRNTATLYAKIGGEWKLVYTVTLSGNSKVAFAASAGTHEFTNIKISAVKELDSVALTLTDNKGTAVAQGTEVTLKNAYFTVTATVGENGVVMLTGDSAVYSALGYTLSLKSGYVGNYVVLFGGATATVNGIEKQTVSANMSLNDISTSSGNVVFDLDGGELNDKEILAFQRYGEDNMYEKDENNRLGDTGLIGLTGRYGGDFNGDTSSIQFTANGKTNASCGFLGQANPDSGSVTVKVTKDCTQLVFFTGTYIGGDFTFSLLQKGEAITSHTYHGSDDGGTRGKMLVIDLDTSALAEGEEQELTFAISGAHLEFAAFVVLGAEAQA